MSEYVYLLTLTCSKRYAHFPMVDKKPVNDTYECQECKQELNLYRAPHREILKVRKLNKTIKF